MKKLELKKDLKQYKKGTIKSEKEWLNIIGRDGKIEPDKYKSDSEFFKYV